MEPKFLVTSNHGCETLTQVLGSSQTAPKLNPETQKSLNLAQRKAVHPKASDLTSEPSNPKPRARLLRPKRKPQILSHKVFPYLFGVPYSQDSSIQGSIFGPPILGNSHKSLTVETFTFWCVIGNMGIYCIGTV